MRVYVCVKVVYTLDRNGINMEYLRVKGGRRVSHFLQGISAFRCVCRARPCEAGVSQTRPFFMLMARVFFREETRAFLTSMLFAIYHRL